MAGMRGRKGSTHEGGLRSPCLIRYPAKIKPGTKIDEITGAICLMPTLAELAGIRHDSPKQLDGWSVAPLLLGHKVERHERFLFSAWNGKTTVRSRRFRLQGTGQFYDIVNDPKELTDVAGKFPGRVPTLTEETGCLDRGSETGQIKRAKASNGRSRWLTRTRNSRSCLRATQIRMARLSAAIDFPTAPS